MEEKKVFLVSWRDAKIKIGQSRAKGAKSAKGKSIMALGA
jgi:hypothetical protein